MGLKLVRSKGNVKSVGGFVGTWYAFYRDGQTVHTVSLGVPVKGKPPASGDLNEKGDEVFERSRAKAQEKHDLILSNLKEKGDVVREKSAIIKVKTGRTFKDPRLADLADICLGRLGDRSKCHTAMIRSGFDKFAAFALNPPSTELKKAKTLAEVTPELARAFFAYAAERFAFSTVKKWSHRLTREYEIAYPGLDNPFCGARLNVVGGVSRENEDGEKVRLETVVHHRPIDRIQLRKLYAEAESDPLLYALTVTAASTGLRISDCCLLKWSDVDLSSSNPVIFLKTIKTGSTVAVPIFDYRKGSAHYDADLGEFRRLLESANASAREGERYVFPEAARLYLTVKKTDEHGKELPRSRWGYPGRGTIYSRGKALFARALFADDAEIVAEPPKKSVEDVLAEIAASDWTEERKERVSDVYKRHAEGESYRSIQAATGLAKSTISVDLASVEKLTGVKTKEKSGKKSLRELLDCTRVARSAGSRRASVYSWHSLRGSFVVMMHDLGVSLELVKELVGHETVDMTLEYYNPTKKQAAEKAREMFLRGKARESLRTEAALEASGTHGGDGAVVARPSAEKAAEGKLDALCALVSGLTKEERAALVLQLLK